MTGKTTHIRLSPAHREWIEKEAERTGNSFAAIIRGFIESAMNKDNEKKKTESNNE